MKLTIRNTFRGFSLIEVMVAVAVMSFGLLALSALQMSIIRSSAEAKAQATAAELAREKLDDLKAFSTVNESDGDCSNAGSDSYQCIAASASAESINDVNGSFGGVNFTRSWTVQRCTQSAGSFTCSASGTTNAVSGTTPRNEFKTLRASVSWTDANGVGQTITLSDTAAALQPSDTALVNKPYQKNTPRYAKPRFENPASEVGVIPIAVGGGTETAATNPKPDLVVGSSVVKTTFDVLTYAGLNQADNSVEGQSRVETAMVGCTCDFSTGPTATTARGYRPTYWNGSRYVAPNQTSTVPPAGEAASATQDPLCSMCCRDHHDPSGVQGAKFSPYLSTHAHYNSSVTGATAVTAGQYREACRIIRVDGLFRVAADLANDYFGLLATSDLSNPGYELTGFIPDATATTSYQNFVLAYMNARYTTPTVTTNFNVPSSVAVNSLIASNNFKAPSPVSIQNTDAEKRWLHSRGLLVDYLEQEAIDAVSDAKTGCTAQDATSLSQCVLKKLPFTSINLTEIANFRSADVNVAKVTNLDYSESRNSNEPVKGQVTKGLNPPSNPTNVDVITESRKTNSALLDLAFDAISPTDAVLASDTQTFRTGAGAPPVDAGDGQFYVNLVLPSGYPVQSIPVSSKVLTLTSESCTALSPVTSQSCAVTRGTGAAGLGFSNTMAVIVQNYNRQEDTESQASLNNCTGPYGTKTATFNGQKKYTVKKCYNYEVTAATNLTRNEAATTFTTNCSGGVSCVTSSAGKSEATRIEFSRIDKDPDIATAPNTDLIQITLGLESGSPTTQTLTCTYTCDANNAGTGCKNNTEFFTVTSPDCAL